MGKDIEEKKQIEQQDEAVQEPPKAKRRFLPKPIRAGLIWGGSAILAIGAGFASGFLYHKLTDNPQIIEIDAATLQIDQDALMERYQKAKDYEELEPWEVANIGLIKFARTENHRSTAKGEAVAMGLVTQHIRSAAIRNGDQYFEESLSKSEGGLDIQTGWRMYEDEQQVSTLYPSKEKTISSDASKASWDESKKETFEDPEAFKATVGYTISGHLSNYNITEYTYVKEGDDAPSGVPTSLQKTDVGYLLELELDVNLACEDYKVQMKHTSDLYGYPVFSFSHLQMVFDQELNLLEMTSHEKYKAAISPVISSEVEGTITTTYESDGIFPIPGLKDNVPYAN